MEASPKRQKITFVDIWRRASTYIILGILTMFAVALAWDVRHQNWTDAKFDCVLLVAGAGAFAYYYHQMKTVSWEKLGDFVSMSLSDMALDLHYEGPLNKMPKFHGGWTNATLLTRHKDIYYVSQLHELAAWPQTHCPVLVFRGNDDRLHMFSFGKGDIANVPHPLETGMYKTATHHDIIGPARFADTA